MGLVRRKALSATVVSKPAAISISSRPPAPPRDKTGRLLCHSRHHQFFARSTHGRPSVGCAPFLAATHCPLRVRGDVAPQKLSAVGSNVSIPKKEARPE